MMKNKCNVLLILFFCSLFAYGQISPDTANSPSSLFFSYNNLTLDKITYQVDWNSFIITTEIHISWIPDSVAQYTYPKESSFIAQDAFPNIFAEMSNNIYVIGKNSLTDFTRVHSSYQLILSQVLRNTIPMHEIPDRNLSGTTIVFSSSLVDIVNQVIIPSYGTLAVPYVPSTISNISQYTSIIFATDQPIAIKQNPTLSRTYIPKVMPRVYASDTHTIVYTPEYFQKIKTMRDRPYTFLYDYNYPSADTGENPMFIIPEFLSDTYTGDLILNDTDTQVILSSENLRALIEQGLVFFIIPNIEKQGLQ